MQEVRWDRYVTISQFDKNLTIMHLRNWEQRVMEDLARSHFTLCLFITPTTKLTVKVPCDNKKTSLCCRMEKWTIVGMQDFALIRDKIMYKRPLLWKRPILRHLQLNKVKRQMLLSVQYRKCPVRMPSAPPPPEILNIYLDRPQIKVLSVIYWETHLVKYTTQKQLNTAYSITVLQ